MSIPFVSLLGFPVCPSTIFWRIIAIVINPINGHFSGRLPHVRNKVCVIMPSFANGNSSSAIEFVLRKILVIASLLHATPNLIARWIRVFISHSASGSAMFKIHGFVVRFFMTTARLCMKPGQVCRENLGVISAITLTKPFSFSGNIIVSKTNGRKKPESFARKVCWLFHIYTSFLVKTPDLLTQRFGNIYSFGNVDA